MPTDARPDGITPSQTVGPFFAYCLTPGEGRYAFASPFVADLATADAEGERITLEGRVLDGDGAAIADAMVEIWQADGAGRYPGPDEGRANRSFSGFGRVETDPQGRYRFVTVKPGAVPGPNGRVQAPHLNVSLFARGLLRQLHTRIYFADEADANDADPVLSLVPADRRPTLVAERTGAGRYALDLRLQGEAETVFFEV